MQSSGSRNCVSCGRSIAWNANVCPYCGHDYRMQYMPGAPQKKDSAVPVVGGILIIICSLGYIALGGLLVAGSTLALPFSLGSSVVGVACGLVPLLIGILAFLGGVFAVMRKHFGLALLGGILVVPSLLGIIGLILVAVSHENFD